MTRSYLDYNATAPLFSETIQAMTEAQSAFGNPSSVHGEGRGARKIMEDARRIIAREVGAPPQQVYFTASGSEANVFALRPALKKAGVAVVRLITTPVEHDCVLQGHGFEANCVRLLKVDGDGVVDEADFADALNEDGGSPALVSIMLANNETGVIQPLAKLSTLLDGTHHVFHSDGVQGLGKLDIDMRLLGLDMLTLSAHKFGGPKGVGAIIKRTDDIEFAPAIIRGGGQERRTRAGTENVAAIAGFAAAVQKASALRGSGEMQRQQELRDMLTRGVLEHAPNAHIFAKDAERLGNTLCFALPNSFADAALIQFDMGGVALSSGSACSSGKVTPSHVLKAMGVAPDLAKCAMRASLGWASTKEDVQRFLAVLQDVILVENTMAARAI